MSKYSLNGTFIPQIYEVETTDVDLSDYPTTGDMYSLTNILQSQLDTNTAGDVVQSSEIDAVEANLTTTNLNLITEQNARISSDNALQSSINTNTSNITTLDGRITTNDGLIATNTSNITTLDGRITTNDGLIASNTTAISDETIARTNADTSLQNSKINITEKGAVSGVCPLDVNQKIPSVHIPSLGIVDVFVRANITERDLLTDIHTGDVCIITDISKSFVYDGTTWLELLSPLDIIQSVNSQTGNVVLTSSDIGYDNTLSGLTATNTKTAIDELQATKSNNIHLHPYTASLLNRFGMNFDTLVDFIDNQGKDYVSGFTPTLDTTQIIQNGVLSSSSSNTFQYTGINALQNTGTLQVRFRLDYIGVPVSDVYITDFNGLDIRVVHRATTGNIDVVLVSSDATVYTSTVYSGYLGTQSEWEVITIQYRMNQGDNYICTWFNENLIELQSSLLDKAMYLQTSMSLYPLDTDYSHVWRSSYELFPTDRDLENIPDVLETGALSLSNITGSLSTSLIKTDDVLISNAPTQSNHATNKDYVDTSITTHSSDTSLHKTINEQVKLDALSFQGDASLPSFVDKSAGTQRITSITGDGSYIWASSEPDGGLLRYTISDTPVLVDNFDDNPGTQKWIIDYQNHIFLANSAQPLRYYLKSVFPQSGTTLTMSNTGDLVHLSKNETKGHIYVSASLKGLYIVDYNGGTPTEIVNYDAVGSVKCTVSGTGDNLYMVDANNVYLLDITNPLSISITAQQPLSGTPRDIAYDSVNDKVYVASSGSGMYQYSGDLSLPANQWDSGGSYNEIIIVNGYVYVARSGGGSFNGIQVFSTSSPTFSAVNTVLYADPLEALFLYNDKIYAGSSNGVAVFSIGSVVSFNKLAITSDNNDALKISTTDPIIIGNSTIKGTNAITVETPAFNVNNLLSASTIAITDGSIPPFDYYATRKDYVDGLVNPLQTLNVDNNMSGFVDPSAVVVSYDETTRVVSLSGDLRSYYQGVVVPTSTWDTLPAHPDTNAGHFLFYNGTSVVWTNTLWDYKDVSVAFIYKAANALVSVRECHGLMDYRVHRELHDTVGTYLKSGADFSNYTLNDNVDKRPYISETVVYDEDLKSVLTQLNTNQYAVYYLSGTDETHIDIETDITKLSVNNPYYNEFNGSTWVQTLMSNNTYQKIFVLAVPTCSGSNPEAKRFIFIQGQQISISLTDIKAISTSDVNLGDIAGIITEFVFVGEIIVKYSGGNWEIEELNKISGNRIAQISASAGNFASISHTHTTTDITNLSANTVSFDDTTALIGSSLVQGAIEGVNTKTDNHIATTTGNPHSVNKTDIGLSNVANTKVNLNANTAPVATDDSSAGYSVGSRWIDTTNDKEYVCVDATSTSAVWIETTSAGGGSSTALTTTYDNSDSNLVATNVKDAVDELASALVAQQYTDETLKVNFEDGQGYDLGPNNITSYRTAGVVISNNLATYGVSQLSRYGSSNRFSSNTGTVIIGANLQNNGATITLFNVGSNRDRIRLQYNTASNILSLNWTDTSGNDAGTTSYTLNGPTGDSQIREYCVCWDSNNVGVFYEGTRIMYIAQPTQRGSNAIYLYINSDIIDPSGATGTMQVDYIAYWEIAKHTGTSYTKYNGGDVAGSGITSVATNSEFTGTGVIGDVLALSGTIGRSLIPSVNGVYDLGTPTYKFAGLNSSGAVRCSGVEVAGVYGDNWAVSRIYGDGRYANLTNFNNHNHDGAYSLLGHNHDTQYANLTTFNNHNHDTAYSPLGHNHDGVYSPVSHTHYTNSIIRKRSAIQNITSSVETTALYDTVQNGSYITYNAGVFTVSQTGSYLVVGTSEFEYALSGVGRTYILDNDFNTYGHIYHYLDKGPESKTLSAIIPLLAGESFSVKVWQNSGTVVAWGGDAGGPRPSWVNIAVHYLSG